jgi:hypothetical protein
MKNISFFFQFQLGFLFTVTSWYKGERDIVISLPFVDINFHLIQKKYKIK